MSLELQPATHADLRPILGVASEWPSHFTSSGLDHIARDLSVATARLVVADGWPIGFIIWDERPDTIEILWLAVSAKQTRHGVGTMLVRAAMQAAAYTKPLLVKTASLDSRIPDTDFRGEVFKGAHEFYRELGFRVGDRLLDWWGAGNHAIEFRWAPNRPLARRGERSPALTEFRPE